MFRADGILIPHHRQYLPVIGNAMETLLFKRNYLFKVWGSTILVAPIILMLLTAIIMTRSGDKLDTGAFGFIVFSVGYGFVFSIPTFLITYLLFPWLNKRFKRALHLKFILIAIGVACILFTFLILYGSDAYNLNGSYPALTFSIAYAFCLTIFALVFPIEDKKHCL